jgi:DNA polymerase-3 subunit epsilon
VLYLFYDTETTGKWHADLPINHDAQPNLVQLAALMMDADANVLSEFVTIVRPEGWTVSAEVAQIHGISDYRARSLGVPMISALSLFSAFCANCDIVVGHNLSFDFNILTRSYWQLGKPHRIPQRRVCTMLMSKDVLQLPKKGRAKPRPGDLYKWPTLQEAHKFFFDKEFDGAHSAMADTKATADCYWEMKARGIEDVPPKINFIPATQASENSSSPDTRTHEFLASVITGVQDKNLTDWERQFVTDMQSKIDEYGERTMVSQRQWPVIDKLHDIYLRKDS